MNRYMLLFLVICMVIGLWAPIHKQMGRLIFLLTVCLVAFFFLYPNKL